MLTVYTKNNCNACAKAKDLLDKNGIEFETINADENFEAFDFLVDQGHRSFPQIYDGEELYVEGGYAGLLEYFKQLGLKI